MTVKSDMIKSPLFQQFMDQGFWHAHHVDLVWRYNGQDVTEEADWLKDVWYELRGKRPGQLPAPFIYVCPDNFVEFHEDGDTGSVMMTLRFTGQGSLEFSVSRVDPEAREWLAKVLHRQVATMLHEVTTRAVTKLQGDLKELLNIQDRR